MSPLLSRAQADALASAYVAVSLADAQTAKATFPAQGGGISVRFKADGSIVVRRYRDGRRNQVRNYMTLADFVAAHEEAA